MKSPQLNGSDVEIYNKKPLPLYETRQTSSRALMGLYSSQMLLCLGFVLILLGNLHLLSPDNYFGSFNWLTITVFSIGLAINFVSIPYLYFSSYRNFKKEDEFWDREIFWILPLFFFGTFFIYSSHVNFSFGLFLISVVLTLVIHFRFVQISWKLAAKNFGKTLTNYEQYNISLKYLTAYYFLMLILLFSYDPLQHFLIWIRLNY